MPRRVLFLALVFLGWLAIPAELSAEDAAEHVTRAKVWLDKGEYGKAIKDCDQALAVDFQSAEAYNTRGRAWIFVGEYQKALDDCDEALAINPKYAEAYSTRAHVWIFKRNYDKVIADCNKALALDPELAEAYSNRGDAWTEKGDYGKALADCDRAVALDPKFAEAYFNRANLLWRKGEEDKAMTDFKRALAITPDDWKVLNNVGVLLWKQAQLNDNKAAAEEAAGDLEAAKTYRRKSVALKADAKAQWLYGITARPTATDIHSNLGYAYSEANDLDKAESHLNRAVLLKPISPRPHNNLGRVLLRRSQQFNADAHAAEAKGTTDPAEAAKVKQLKDEAKAKLDAAIEQFEKAVELDPALLEARLNLGEVYTTVNDLDKAESHYKAILRLYSVTFKDRETINNFSQAWFGLARVAIARKKPDEAIRDLQKAIELNPKNVAALQLLAALRNPQSRSAAKKSGDKSPHSKGQ